MARHLFCLSVVLLFLAEGASAQIPQEEKRFINTLIFEYRVLDIAARYCSEKIDTATDSMDRASYRWFLEADIPRVRGDLEASQKANDALAKEFPRHPRAAQARLDNVMIEVDRLTQTWDNAMLESDLDKRKELMGRIVTTFETVVRKEFKSLIADLNKRLDPEVEGALKQPAYGEEDTPEAKEFFNVCLLRDKAEFFWIMALKRLARFMDQEGYRDKRKKALEEAYAAADEFTEVRSTFDLLRYEAQLEKGLCLIALGRYKEAADQLSLLRSLHLVARRATPEAKEPLHQIHLRAYLNLIRCYNESKQYTRAAEVSDQLFSEKLLSIFKEYGSLEPYLIEAQLESGVSLAGVGRPHEAAKTIKRIIDKYKAPDIGKQDLKAVKYVSKARVALARMVMVAGPIFSPDTILEAGIGYKNQKEWEKARAIFQLGLGFDGTGSERSRCYPLFLKEMALCAYYSGDLFTMLFSSCAALRHFADTCPKDLRRQLSTYAYTAALDLKKTNDNPGFQLYFKESEDYFEKWGDPAQQETRKMNEGLDFKGEQKYTNARDRFLSVNPTYEEKRVKKPYKNYWRCRAEAADCLYQVYLKEKEDKEKEADPDKLKKVEQELLEALSKAKEAGQINGQAAAAYYLAVLYQESSLQDQNNALQYLSLFDDELKDDTEYRDSALRLHGSMLMRFGKAQEAYNKLLVLEKDYPPSKYPKNVEMVNLALDGFFYYYDLGSPVYASYYARKCLAHPTGKQYVENNEDIHFAFGNAFAESGKEQFTKLATKIFEPLWEQKESLSRDRKIAVARGLARIYNSEGKYEDSIALLKEILGQLKETEYQIVEIWQDLVHALVQQANNEIRRGGDKQKATDYVLEASKLQGRIVLRVRQAFYNEDDPQRRRMLLSLLLKEELTLYKIRIALGRKKSVYLRLKRDLEQGIPFPNKEIEKQYKAFFEQIKPR